MLMVASKLGLDEIEALGSYLSFVARFVPHRDGTLYMTLRRLTLARLLFAVVCLYDPRQRSRTVSAGRPASLTATLWKFMARASACGESMRPKAASFVVTMRACIINAARRPQTNLTPSLRDGRSIARP